MQAPNRILLVTLISSRGGAGTQILDLGRAMTLSGSQIDLVLPSSAEASFVADWTAVTNGRPPLLADALHHQRVNKPGNGRVHAVVDVLNDAIRSTDANVVHSHALANRNVRLALAAIKQPGLAIVDTIHDGYAAGDLLDPDPNDVTVCVSRYLRQLYFPDLPPRESADPLGAVQVVHPGMLWPAAHPAADEEIARQPGPRVVLLGDYQEAKGWRVLLEATKRVEDRGYPVGTLVFSVADPVAARYERYTQDQAALIHATAQSSGVRARILTVRRRQEEVASVNAAADLAVFPAMTFGEKRVQEGFGLGPPQARLYTATITSDSGGLPESLAPELAGDRNLVVPMGDVDALADAMIWNLYGPRAERDRVRRIAREHAAATFSIDRFVKRMQDVYALALDRSMSANPIADRGACPSDIAM